MKATQRSRVNTMGAQATTLRKSSPGAALLKATRQGDVQRAEEVKRTDKLCPSNSAPRRHRRVLPL